jgi:hypothetical protein
MKQHGKKTGSGIELQTIRLSPLTLARGAATELVGRVRQAVNVVQAVRSSVKSVAVSAAPMQLTLKQQAISEAAVVKVPMGLSDVAVLGGLQVSNINNTVTVRMNVDTFFIDRLAQRMPGTLMSNATCRFSTELRVVLRETIDGSVGNLAENSSPSSARRYRKLLPRPLVE